MKEFGLFGNKGTFKQMNFKVFETLEAAKTYCEANNIKICGNQNKSHLKGIEIMENARSITDHPFSGDTCFVLGNEVSLILLKFLGIWIE